MNTSQKAFDILWEIIKACLFVIIGFGISTWVFSPPELELKNTTGFKVLTPQKIETREVPIRDYTEENILRQKISYLTSELLEVKNRGIEVRIDTVYEEKKTERYIDKIMFQYLTTFEDRKIDEYSNLKVITFAPSIVDSIKVSGTINYQKYYDERIKPNIEVPFWQHQYIWYSAGAGLITGILLSK